jgi:hypothetical protein
MRTVTESCGRREAIITGWNLAADVNSCPRAPHLHPLPACEERQIRALRGNAGLLSAFALSERDDRPRAELGNRNPISKGSKMFFAFMPFNSRVCLSSTGNLSPSRAESAQRNLNSACARHFFLSLSERERTEVRDSSCSVLRQLASSQTP